SSIACKAPRSSSMTRCRSATGSGRSRITPMATPSPAEPGTCSKRTRRLPANGGRWRTRSWRCSTSACCRSASLPIHRFRHRFIKGRSSRRRIRRIHRSSRTSASSTIPTLRRRISIVIAAVVLGAFFGGGTIWIILTHETEAKQVAGHTLSFWTKALQSDDDNLRAAAALALTQFGPDAIAPTIELLDNATAQSAAADALAVMGNSAVKPLIHVLSAPSSARQKLGAIRALDQMGWAGADATTAVGKLIGDEEVGSMATEFI